MPSRSLLDTAAAERLIGPRSARRSVEPDARDLQLMRIVAILQYLIGGLVLVVAASLVPDPDPSDHRAYLVLGTIALALAGMRFLRKRDITLTHARASNLAGLLFISAVVAVSSPLGGTQVFYLWPVLTAAYFLRRRDLGVVVGLFLVLFAAALWSGDTDGSEPTVYVCTVLVVLIVTALVRVMRESMAKLIDDLEQGASTDYLTGVANRAALHRGFERMIEAARRGDSQLCVVMADLDHFKAINDAHGHEAGDATLQFFGRLLRAESRNVDLAARLGGEEFVVVLDGVDLRGAAVFAERLRERVARESAVSAVACTVSLGVAQLAPHHAGPDDVLRDADTALYAAKAAGRNRVAVSPPIAKAAPAGHAA